MGKFKEQFYEELERCIQSAVKCGMITEEKGIFVLEEADYEEQYKWREWFFGEEARAEARAEQAKENIHEMES